MVRTKKKFLLQMFPRTNIMVTSQAVNSAGARGHAFWTIGASAGENFTIMNIAIPNLAHFSTAWRERIQFNSIQSDRRVVLEMKIGPSQLG